MESEIYNLVKDNLWVAIGIIGTLVTVQAFKGLLKTVMPPVTWRGLNLRKLIIGLFAVTAGWFITQYFMDGDPNQKKWAVAVALLNPLIYHGILTWAIKNNKLWLIALLKSRKFVKRDGVEKIINDDGKTYMMDETERRKFLDDCSKD